MPWEVATFSADEQAPQKYTMEPHSWKQVRFFSWPVCRYCGLVLLRNSFTKWCGAHGCNYRLHPGYQVQRNAAGIDPLERAA